MTTAILNKLAMTLIKWKSFSNSLKYVKNGKQQTIGYFLRIFMTCKCDEVEYLLFAFVWVLDPLIKNKLFICFVFFLPIQRFLCFSITKSISFLCSSLSKSRLSKYVVLSASTGQKSCCRKLFVFFMLRWVFDSSCKFIIPPVASKSLPIITKVVTSI